jgi:hypothetical protein
MKQMLLETMDVEALENLYARTTYLLRESRKEILKRYAVDDEVALLEKIRAGEIAAHPAYEHYLSALILEQTRAQVQAEMVALGKGSVDDVPAISVHLMLKERLERDYIDRMSEPPRLAQDALTLAFSTGLLMELRYFSADAYSIEWSNGEHDLRIDTAPAGAEARHLHGPAGGRLPAGLMRPGVDCWKNFSGLLDVLLRDPLLENKESVPRMELAK